MKTLSKLIITILLFIISGIVYGTGNNKLLLENREPCYNVESNIYNKVVDATLIDSINACLKGNTFSYVWHWGANDTFEKDGKKYKLQYFKTNDDINEAVTDIDDVLNKQKQEVEQEEIETEQKEQQKLKRQQEQENQSKICNAQYENSVAYRNYKIAKDNAINTRYNTCINNGYTYLTCYKAKIEDQVGYDMTNNPPINHCP